MPQHFRFVEETLVHQGHVVGFFRSTFETPDGDLMVRDVIRHPGAVTIVPLHDDGSVTLVRQFRAPLSTDLLEAPAGKIDPGEDDLAAVAHRELTEETGLRAGRLDLLTSMAQSPGFSDERNHIYLARDLTQGPRELDGPEERHMSLVRCPLSSVPAMIASGEMVDGKSMIGLLLALRLVDQ